MSDQQVWARTFALVSVTGLTVILGKLGLNRRAAKLRLAVAERQRHMENVLRKVNELNAWDECKAEKERAS